MIDLSWIALRNFSTRLVPFNRFSLVARLVLLFVFLATGTNVVAQTTQPAPGKWIPPSQRKPLPSTQPTEPVKRAPTAEAVSKCTSYRLTRGQDGQNTYAFYFKNVTSFDVSQLVLVSLAEPLNASHKELPANARPPLILQSPADGTDLSKSIEVLENDKTQTPILYLAVSSPQLREPLWIRVSPDCTPRDGFVDPAARLLAMADQVAAVGNKDAAKERYLRVLSDYPEFPAAKIAQAKLGWSDEQLARFFPTINSSALAASALAIATENEQRRIATDVAMQRERTTTAAEPEDTREQIADRAALDPLLKIQGNIVDIAGFPKDVLPEGAVTSLHGNGLRVAAAIWGKADVFCVDPVSEQVPAIVDMSAITGQGSGTLRFSFRNAPGGNCRLVVRIGRSVKEFTLDGDRWVDVAMPFEACSTSIEIHATGWWREMALITYEVQRSEGAGDHRRSQRQTAVATPAPISDDEATTYRQKLVAELDKGVSEAQRELHQLPANSSERAKLTKQISAMLVLRNQLKALTLDQIKHAIIVERLENAERLRLARERAEQAAADFQAARARKFPHWEGPWQRCPICEGTGHDAEAERAENNRRASIASAGVAGSGTTITIPASSIACDVCGGTGQVPDTK